MEIVLALGAVVFAQVLSVRWDRAVDKEQRNKEGAARESLRIQHLEERRLRDATIEHAVGRSLERNTRAAGRNIEIIDSELRLMATNRQVGVLPLQPMDESWWGLLILNLPERFQRDSLLIRLYRDLAEQTAFVQACIDSRERLKTQAPSPLNYSEALGKIDSLTKQQLSEVRRESMRLLYGE